MLKIFLNRWLKWLCAWKQMFGINKVQTLTNTRSISIQSIRLIVILRNGQTTTNWCLLTSTILPNSRILPYYNPWEGIGFALCRSRQTREVLLQAELVQGKNKTGTTIDLHKGLNPIYVNELSHSYINYMMDDVNLKYTELPKIRIHVEGGRANGYFDATKMKNEDWNKLRVIWNNMVSSTMTWFVWSLNTPFTVLVWVVWKSNKIKETGTTTEKTKVSPSSWEMDWVHTLEQGLLPSRTVRGSFPIAWMFNTDAADFMPSLMVHSSELSAQLSVIRNGQKVVNMTMVVTSGLWCTKLVTTIRNSSTWHAAWEFQQPLVKHCALKRGASVVACKLHKTLRPLQQ